jgi:HK97 gp10 family phage protein
MSTTVTGDRDLVRKLNRLGSKMNDAVDQGVELTANEVRTDAIKSIMSKSAGHPVRRSRQGGGTYAHIAANVGQAPNNDNGDLVKSIAVEKESDAHYVVGSNLEYSAWLEMGTKKMGAHPWLEPALRRNIDNLTRNVSKTADLAIQKAKK